MDRNLRGAWYTYCDALSCHELKAGHSSWKDVHYKHHALKRCREWVRERYPDKKPECAIYAIEDNIVRAGSFPWRVDSDRHVSHSQTAAADRDTPTSFGTLSTRSIAVTWEGYSGVLTGTITLRQGGRAGRMNVRLVENETACEGQYWLLENTGSRNGRREIDCGAGLTAEAIVVTVSDTVDSNVATKTDLARLETRVVLAIVAVGGSVVALLKLLP